MLHVFGLMTHPDTPLKKVAVKAGSSFSNRIIEAHAERPRSGGPAIRSSLWHRLVKGLTADEYASIVRILGRAPTLRNWAFSRDVVGALLVKSSEPHLRMLR